MGRPSFASRNKSDHVAPWPTPSGSLQGAMKLFERKPPKNRLGGRPRGRIVGLPGFFCAQGTNVLARRSRVVSPTSGRRPPPADRRRVSPKRPCVHATPSQRHKGWKGRLKQVSGGGRGQTGWNDRLPRVSLTRISGQGQGGMRGDAIGTERSEGDERSRVCKLTLHMHH